MSRVAAFGEVRQREPRVRDKRHLGLVAKLPCIACLVRRGIQMRPVHVAHCRASYPEPGWRQVGAGEKPSDTRTTPLCPSCHLTGKAAQHGMNEAEFWRRLGIYPPEFCAALVAAFAAGQTGERVVQEFAARGRMTCALGGRMP